jgi:hypothetical protein
VNRVDPLGLAAIVAGGEIGAFGGPPGVLIGMGIGGLITLAGLIYMAKASKPKCKDEPEEKDTDKGDPQEKKLSDGEIQKIKDSGIDIHDLKPNSKYDLFKDLDGDIYVKPKNGVGPGDWTGLNINNFH